MNRGPGSVDIGVVPPEEATVEPEGIDRTSTPGEVAQPARPCRDRLLVWDRDISSYTLRATVCQRRIKAAGGDVHALVGLGEADGFERRALKERRQRVRDRVAQNHQSCGAFTGNHARSVR